MEISNESTKAIYASSKDADEAAKIFSLLASPTRLKILSVVMETKEEMCVMEISEAVDLSHSATSHQLSKLVDRNILTYFRKGQTICYKPLNTPEAKKVKKILKQISS